MTSLHPCPVCHCRALTGADKIAFYGPLTTRHKPQICCAFVHWYIQKSYPQTFFLFLDVSSIIATEVVNSIVKVLTHHNRQAYHYEIFPTFYTNLLYHTSAKQTSSGLYAIHILHSFGKVDCASFWYHTWSWFMSLQVNRFYPTSL